MKSRKRRLLLTLGVGAALFAALVGAKAAWSAVFVQADDGATAVVGGLHRDTGQCFFLLDGTPTFCSGVTVDYNIDVHGLGSGPATGTLLSGEDGGTRAISVRATCMTVAGNKAVVGGFITSDTLNPDFVGDELLFYVIDNGGPGNAPLDKMSGNEVTTPDSFTPGFPRSCGPPISTFTGYTDVKAGDVSIHSGL